jgi:hypothetical protein
MKKAARHSSQPAARHGSGPIRGLRGKGPPFCNILGLHQVKVLIIMLSGTSW